MGGDKGTKGRLTCLHKCVLTRNTNMSGAKGMFPLCRLQFFWGIWGKEGGEGAGVLFHIASLFYP